AAGERQMFPKQTNKMLLDIGGAAEAIGAIDGTRIVSVAFGATQILFQTLPTTTAQDTVDSLQGAFGIFRFLNRGFIIVVAVPIVTPLVHIAGHIVETKASWRVTQHSNGI